MTSKVETVVQLSAPLFNLVWHLAKFVDTVNVRGVTHVCLWRVFLNRHLISLGSSWNSKTLTAKHPYLFRSWPYYKNVHGFCRHLEWMWTHCARSKGGKKCSCTQSTTFFFDINCFSSKGKPTGDTLIRLTTLTRASWLPLCITLRWVTYIILAFLTTIFRQGDWVGNWTEDRFFNKVSRTGNWWSRWENPGKHFRSPSTPTKITRLSTIWRCNFSTIIYVCWISQLLFVLHRLN